MILNSEAMREQGCLSVINATTIQIFISNLIRLNLLLIIEKDYNCNIIYPGVSI